MLYGMTMYSLQTVLAGDSALHYYIFALSLNGFTTLKIILSRSFTRLNPIFFGVARGALHPLATDYRNGSAYYAKHISTTALCASVLLALAGLSLFEVFLYGDPASSLLVYLAFIVALGVLLMFSPLPIYSKLERLEVYFGASSTCKRLLLASASEIKNAVFLAKNNISTIYFIYWIRALPNSPVGSYADIAAVTPNNNFYIPLARRHNSRMTQMVPEVELYGF